MFKKLVWFWQRHIDLLKKQETRVTTQQVIDMYNKCHARMLELDRQGKDIREISGWVNTLSWILTGKKK